MDPEFSALKRPSLPQKIFAKEKSKAKRSIVKAPFPYEPNSRVTLEWTSIIGWPTIGREAYSNGRTRIARAKRIKLRRSPYEAQLARVIPLQVLRQLLFFVSHSIGRSWIFTHVNLAIDHSRVGDIGGGNLMRANLTRSGEYCACGQTGGFDLGFREALKHTADGPIVAIGFKVE